MSKLNPYDLVGMRKAAERTTVSTQRRYAKVLDPDLLSIAGQVAEAARQLLDIGNSDEILIHHGLINVTQTARENMRAALASWDAAMKGRK